jgi:hypothetical protein
MVIVKISCGASIGRQNVRGWLPGSATTRLRGAQSRETAGSLRRTPCHSLQEATGYAMRSTWIRHWAPIVGWPLQTYTDNGSHFRNAIVMTVFANHGTNMGFALVSHPASVGLSERMVRMLKQQLSRWAISRRGAGLAKWHIGLADMVININTRFSSTLGATPSEVFLTPLLMTNRVPTNRSRRARLG